MDMAGGGNMMGVGEVGGLDGAWTQRPVAAKTGGTPGINMEEIFGEEWAGGWINQGFKQP